MGTHINEDGFFQSDKYPTCPPGKGPLSVKDTTAQDLLWEYAQRRRAVDAEFAADLETVLKKSGFVPPRERMRAGFEIPLCDCGANTVCAGLNGTPAHSAKCATQRVVAVGGAFPVPQHMSPMGGEKDPRP